MVVQILNPLPQRRPPAVLAQHEFGPWDADVFGLHDFVSAAVFQHAVLVNARFVGERIRPDDGFVALHLHPGHVR